MTTPIQPIQVGQHLQPQVVMQQEITDKARGMLQLFEKGALERGEASLSLKIRFSKWYNQREIEEKRAIIRKILSDIGTNPPDLQNKLVELFAQAKEFDRVSVEFAQIEEFAYRILQSTAFDVDSISRSQHEGEMVKYWGKLGIIVSHAPYFEKSSSNIVRAFKSYGDLLCSEFEADPDADLRSFLKDLKSVKDSLKSNSVKDRLKTNPEIDTAEEEIRKRLEALNLDPARAQRNLEFQKEARKPFEHLPPQTREPIFAFLRSLTGKEAKYLVEVTLPITAQNCDPIIIPDILKAIHTIAKAKRYNVAGAAAIATQGMRSEENRQQVTDLIASLAKERINLEPFQIMSSVFQRTDLGMDERIKIAQTINTFTEAWGFEHLRALKALYESDLLDPTFNVSTLLQILIFACRKETVENNVQLLIKSLVQNQLISGF